MFQDFVTNTCIELSLFKNKNFRVRLVSGRRILKDFRFAPASCLLPPASCLLPPASCLLPNATCLLKIYFQVEQFRLRCYMASLQSGELPNPKVNIWNKPAALNVAILARGFSPRSPGQPRAPSTDLECSLCPPFMPTSVPGALGTNSLSDHCLISLDTRVLCYSPTLTAYPPAY